MVRLSEILERSQDIKLKRTRPKRMRLSDAMRMGSFEVPRNDLEDKGIGGNLVEGVLKGFASAPQVPGKIAMAFGDFVRSE